MNEWPQEKFRVILADPPWTYQDKACQGAAAGQYATMDLNALKALPVRDLAEPDSVLLLWATFPLLPEALGLMAAWGFTYRTVAFTWVKTGPAIWKPFVGLGRWTRGNAEVCFLGKRGSPKRKAMDVEQVILSPVREHSRKPDEQYSRIERLLDGPYCELFSRYPRPNWTSWGNERRPRQMALDEAA